jgi:hypothetical protein
VQGIVAVFADPVEVFARGVIEFAEAVDPALKAVVPTGEPIEGIQVGDRGSDGGVDHGPAAGNGESIQREPKRIGPFVENLKILAAARHFVAHRGVALPQLIVLRDREMTTEELDRKIEESPAWQRMAGMFGKEFMEQFRATWRYRMLREEFETFSEPGFEVELDDRKVLIFPLVNVEWDFANFFRFVENVAAESQRALGLGA